jgi:hypothetical protein
MQKDVYLIRGMESDSYDDFKRRIFSMVDIVKSQCDSVKLVLTEQKPPKITVIPFRKSKIAAISVYYSKQTAPIPSLLKSKGFAGMYKVMEALPVKYDKTWADGEITPGVCLLTLFRKKKKLEYEKFLDRWHNGHTPLSLKIHPLWHYNRNVVEEEHTDNNDKFDGIVEEHCKTSSELFNPFKFFGNPLVIIPRMLQVYFDVNSFIDYPSIEPYLVSEYHIKSQF